MNNDLTDPQALALEVFKGNTPCIVSLVQGCAELADWVIRFGHLEGDCDRLKPNPMPFCDKHKDMIVHSFNPFWRTYLEVTPMTCSECDGELELGGVTKL